MATGKLTIISSTLKLDRPFRAGTVMEMTGLSRQLVHYHLNELVEQGMLRKSGTAYEIIERELMLDSLVEIAERTETAKMEQKNTILSKDFVDVANDLAEGIVCAMVFDKSLAPEVKTVYVKRIDKTVSELKKLRKFLNAAQRSERSATRKLNEMDLELVWRSWLAILEIEPSIGFEEWASGMNEGKV